MKRKLWIILALAALIAAVWCTAALADDSGSCGENVTCTFDSATGTLTISGTEAMANYLDESSVPWYSYRGDVLSVTIADGVTTIGIRAFYDCAGLTNVTMGI